MKRLLVGQLQYKLKAQKIVKFRDPKGDKKEVFSQGTYMAQNFMSQTSTIFHCITKRNFQNMSNRNKGIKLQSYIHSYSFIL